MERAPVIGHDADAARRLLQDFRAAAGIPSDAPSDLFEATVSDPRFPGALLGLPVTAGGEAVFYSIATTAAEWRQLRALLMAFAGPTLTDFAGAPTELHAGAPHERVLAAAAPAAVARLRAPPATAVSTERALKRMVAMVGRAPEKAAPASESTGRLLARIRDHLNALAIDDARQLLERCRAEHRLDALNLKFLEVEILATARDWRGVVGLDGFDDLLRTRRPPAVTAALLEALYWTGLGDEPQNPGRYTGAMRRRTQDLIRLPAPPGMAEGAWRLYALEALACTPPNIQMAAAVLQSNAELGDLRERLSEAVAAATPPSPQPVNPAAAVTAADLSGSLSAFERAQAMLAALSPAERSALLEAAQPRAALAAMEATFGSHAPPSSWLAWMGRIEDPAFTTALAVARRGAVEWAADIADPVEVQALATALLGASDTPPAGERLLDALPHLVAWMLRDTEFPRTSGQPLYEAALDRLLLSGRTSTPLLDSATVLARALLALGLPPDAYRRLLMDLVEASGEAAGLRTAYWLIELIEETLAASSPDQAAREAFWQNALMRLAPIARLLSPLQRLSLRRLATAAGWAGAFDEEPDAIAAGATDATLPSLLAGKMVAIYTLTTSAGAQAAEALKAIAPDVDVRINSEHDGSSRLQALAENADLFVLVAASATHAATDVIRAHRGGRPLVYAAGRGAVSILRSVEDWARSQG
jgi:hypothetical protein